MQVDPGFLGRLGLGPAALTLTRSRANGVANMLEAMKRRARMLAGDDLPRFPSLHNRADGTWAQGAFAEAQVGWWACVFVPGGEVKGAPCCGVGTVLAALDLVF